MQAPNPQSGSNRPHWDEMVSTADGIGNNGPGQPGEAGLRHEALVSAATPLSDFNNQMVLQTSGLGDDLHIPGFDEQEADTTLLLQGVPDWFDVVTPMIPLEYQYDKPTSRRLLEVYYLRFHAAHPILLPLRQWTKQLVKNYPYFLTQVMQFIGSQCESTIPDREYRKALRCILASHTVRNGYVVQAMLLFAILEHANNEQQAARDVLDTAIQIALDLGMSRAEFASNNGEGSQSLEESWRRTWWELYVLDGMLAALNQQTSFRLNSVDSNVPLPCEEADYSLSDSIPKTCTIHQLQPLTFAREVVVHSSFAYRIEAIRLLGIVLGVDRSIYTNNSHDFDVAETSLSSWLLCLPASKHEILTIDGKLDEMLFQAHMIFNAATIYLHQPQSSLIPGPSIDAMDAPCTQRLHPMRGAIAQKRQLHLTKTTSAAAKLSELVLLPTPLDEHTPFFICTIALIAMVNIAAHTALVLDDGVDLALLKQRVILATGALNTLTSTWPVAGRVCADVKNVARMAFGDAAAEPLVGGFVGEGNGDPSGESFEWQQ